MCNGIWMRGDSEACCLQNAGNGAQIRLMSLKIEFLSSAIARLEESVALYESDTDNLVVRDGVVQRFEFTYELAYRMLRRALQRDMGSAEVVEQMTFAEVVRSGWSKSLLREELPVWRDFRKKRNLTSHTYNQANAEAVYAVVPRFLAEAKFLLSQLEKRNDDDPLD